MTDDAKRVLLEYADGSMFGLTAVRSLLGSTVRAIRAIDSLTASGHARVKDDGRLSLYRLTAKGRDLAQAARELPTLRGTGGGERDPK